MRDFVEERENAILNKYENFLFIFTKFLLTCLLTIKTKPKFYVSSDR